MWRCGRPCRACWSGPGAPTAPRPWCASCARKASTAECGRRPGRRGGAGRHRQLRDHRHRSRWCRARGCGPAPTSTSSAATAPTCARPTTRRSRAATPIVVDTRAGALAEAGDLVQALARGVITPERISGELAELLRGDCAGRTARRSDHAVQVGRHRARRPGGCTASCCSTDARSRSAAASHATQLVDDQQTAPSVIALSARLKLGKYESCQ